MRAKVSRIVNWLIFLLIASIALYFLYTHLFLVYSPNVYSVDDRLPTVFHLSTLGFWGWVVGLGIVAGSLAWWSVHLLKSIRRSPESFAGSDEFEHGPALAVCWKEIQRRLHFPFRTPVYLVAGSPSAQTAALLNASGLSGDDPVPAATGSLIQAFRTEEGLIVWCGAPMAETLGFAAHTIAQVSPGLPQLRAILVQINALELSGTQAASFVDAIRKGLRAAWRALPTRHPVFLLITGMEEVHGFLEFVSRLPAEWRNLSRCGFAMAQERQPDQKYGVAAYARFLRGQDKHIRDLLAHDPRDRDGNEGLVALGLWFHDVQPALLSIIDAVAHSSADEAIEVSGCYFLASGSVPERQAFAASTLRGRVVGGPPTARWARRTLETDCTYRK